MSAEDILQQVFLRLWRTVPNPSLITNHGAYMASMVRNVSRSTKPRDEPHLPEMEGRYQRVSELPTLLEQLDQLMTELEDLRASVPKPLSAEYLIPTVRNVVQEESTAHNYVTRRYRELIDRKYLNGLSQTENDELNALTLTLEEMDKPYYEAIVDRLCNLIEQR